MAPPLDSPPSPRLRVFAYVDAERAPLYRQVMRAFMRARDGFRLHLRPLEVTEALTGGGGFPLELPELEPALRQLCDWGNLVAHPDTAEVTTVEEFYRPRFLFQLTAEGETAERAIDWYEQTIHKPGELQTAALLDIRTHLAELATLALSGELDTAKAANALAILRDRFTSLTDRAQAFMASLQRGIDLHGLELAQFLQYKERLIDYLERFIGELVIATSEISELVDRIESLGVSRLLAAAAQRELVDRLSPSAEEVERVHADWTRRWEGLRTWFVARGNQRAQA
ncbi:MAG: TIGR02677 family protein, partial [Myxococcaceae bacterium]